MSTSIAVRRYLETQDVFFSTVTCPWDNKGRIRKGSDKSINLDSVARPILLKDASGLVMAVIPITHRLNLELLNQQMHRQLKLADHRELQNVFADCNSMILPALGEVYGLETVIDSAILDQDMVYVSSGNNDELIRLSGNDFQLLNQNAWYSDSFSNKKVNRASQVSRASQNITPKENKAKPRPVATDAIASQSTIRQKIERTTKLPPMPTITHKIIQLNSNPYAHAGDLAKLVSNDPSLTAQIIRYAQSPFFGYQGKVTSVRQAISRVLGYDMVMNIALGIAAARPFKVPLDGPLGLNAFWRHSTYCAALCQALCNLIPRNQRPRLGIAYLTGLLHNFGILILGHLFPNEFNQLDNAVRNEPEKSIVELEQGLLGITHMEMGTWLMNAWNMPQEVIVANQEHHNPGYDGPYSNYVKLVYLANCLLKKYELGDSDREDIPSHILHDLGLSEPQVMKVLKQTIEGRDELDVMASQLVA